MRTHPLAAALIGLCVACATDEPKEDKGPSPWIGQDLNEVVAEFGAPTAIMDDGKGGQIFVYTTSKTTPPKTVTVEPPPQRPVGVIPPEGGRVLTAQREYLPYTYTTPGYTETKTRTFWIGPDGLVYRVASKNKKD